MNSKERNWKASKRYNFKSIAQLLSSVFLPFQWPVLIMFESNWWNFYLRCSINCETPPNFVDWGIVASFAYLEIALQRLSNLDNSIWVTLQVVIASHFCWLLSGLGLAPKLLKSQSLVSPNRKLLFFTIEFLLSTTHINVLLFTIDNYSL